MRTREQTRRWRRWSLWLRAAFGRPTPSTQGFRQAFADHAEVEAHQSKKEKTRPS